MKQRPASLIASPGVVRPMLRLAAPVLVEQILSMALAFVDQWLAGRYLEEPHLAAIGLIWYVLWLIPSLFGVVAIAATAVVARQVGAGDLAGARRTTHQALVLGGVIAAVVTLGAWLAGPWFFFAMRLSDDAARHALSYWNTLVIVIPCFMIVQVGSACLRGAGDTYSGFAAMTLVNVINALLGAALISGWGPFPQWGWQGLAVATAVGQAVGAIALLWMLRRGRAGLTLRWSRLRFDAALSRRLLRIGVPGGADMVTLVSCHLVFVALINRLGDVPAAAHGLAVRLEALAYLPGTAFQVAAATLVGQYLGARDPHRAQQGALAATAAAAAIMCSMGLFFYLLADPLTAWFVSEANRTVAAEAAPLLRIVAYSMPSLAITMVLIGALRGAGDTRWPLVITLLGFVGVRLPLAYWLTSPAVGWGVQGAWIAMITDIIFRSGLVAARFRHGGWREAEV